MRGRSDIFGKCVLSEVNWLLTLLAPHGVLVAFAVYDYVPIRSVAIRCGPGCLEPWLKDRKRNENYALAASAAVGNIRAWVLMQELLLMRVKRKPVVGIGIGVVFLGY